MIKKSISLIAVMLTMAVAAMAQKQVVKEDYWWNDQPDSYVWSSESNFIVNNYAVATMPQEMEG